MDSYKSLWNNLLATKTVLDTTKAFFGKYLYRAELKVNGLYCLRRFKGKVTTLQKITDCVNDMRELAQTEVDAPYYAYSWFRDKSESAIASDPATLWLVQIAISRFPKQISSRIEGDKLTIYASTPDILAKTLSDPQFVLFSLVTTITRPASEKTKLQLLKNIVLVKQVTHNYRVTIKEGRYDKEVQQQLLSYLTGFGDEVRFSAGLRTRLKDPNMIYLYGTFFVNDPDILIFIKLISPGFVGSIFKLEEAEQ